MPLPFAPERLTPFRSDRSGGRLIFDRDGDLIVGFGDHELDGVRFPEKASRNDGSSYGKVVTIDLRTLESRGDRKRSS